MQYAQAAKGGSAAAGVAALSLDEVPPQPTLWVLVDLERPVFCPEHSICVASKLEVRAKVSSRAPPPNALNPHSVQRSSMRRAAELRFMDASPVF